MGACLERREETQVHEKKVENSKIGNYEDSFEYINEEKSAIVRNLQNLTIPHKDPNTLRTNEDKAFTSYLQ